MIVEQLTEARRSKSKHHEHATEAGDEQRRGADDATRVYRSVVLELRKIKAGDD